MQKIKKIIKKLKHPQVRSRMKIAAIFWTAFIFSGITFKIGHDLGHFQAYSHKQGLLESKTTDNTHLITLEKAQQIVNASLRESSYPPKTVVKNIIRNEYPLTALIIERDGSRKIAWLLNDRYYMEGVILNTNGDDLTTLYINQYLKSQ